MSARRALITAEGLREPEAALSGYTVGVTSDRHRDELAGLLEGRGARVVLAPTLRIVPITDIAQVPVYRWAAPSDSAPLHRLIDLITGRLIDAVTFTAAPAVTALVRAGGPALLDAFRTHVIAACLSSVTATPLRRLGVPVVAPARARLNALVRTLVDELPKRAQSLEVAGHALTLRGHAAIVDGELHPLAPAPMAVLRALVAAPGRVLSRADLLHALPGLADEHAVEMAVARLRAGLGSSGIVQTVVKRGYRLPV